MPRGPMAGTAETIRYLKDLPPEQLPLILEFSRPILMTAPRDALPVRAQQLCRLY
jgi:hypothetical protein